MIPFFTYKRFNLESLRNVVKGTQLVNGRTWAQGWVFPSNSFQPKWSFSVVLLSVNLVCMLRLLPLAAVWNHCRLGGLETETDRLTVLKAGNVKAACRPGCVPCWASRAFSPSPLPDSGGYWRSLASDCAIWSRPPSPQRLLLCVSPFLSLTRTHVIGFRAHPLRSQLKILNFVTSAKTLSPNKVMFTFSRDLHMASFGEIFPLGCYMCLEIVLYKLF